MSNDTMVTLQGWVGSAPSTREVGGASVASFRIGCTPRRFHRQRQEWVDGETQWYTVNAWRALADHCARSLRKGDPVLVHGRLTHRAYLTKSNVEVVALEVEATAVGHDLSRGVSQFMKVTARETTRPGQDQTGDHTGSAEPGTGVNGEAAA